MAHLYIPLDGVPIVPTPPTPDFIAADGYVVFALSVRQFYAYNQALATWQPAGGGVIVADTDSVDLTDTAGTLTADVLISSDSAPLGSVKATITVQPAPNPGLLAVVAESDIQALFSATDTDSVDLSYTAGAYSADLKLSSNAADTGYQLVDLNVETGAGAGLRAQIADSAIQGLISVSDSNSIDFSYTTGAISGDVRLSNNAADTGYTVVPIDIQTTGTVGLRAQIANSDIQGALSVTDTDEINLTYTGGNLSANLVFSADPPDLNYEKVELSIRNGMTSPGLFAQIAHTEIRDAISVSDTNSIDMTYGAGQINGDVRLSSDAADAGYTIVGLTIQSGASKGLRAQIQNTAVFGLFTATAPVLYSNTTGAFSFDTATTTLTAYLLKSGGTMTGAIVSAIPYANAGVVSTALHPAAWERVNNNRETTLTFDITKGEAFKFIVMAQGRSPIEVMACYHTTAITTLTDHDNLYLEADSGTGFYIHKTASSAAITIKKNISGNNDVLITIKEGVLLSATAWA